MRWSSRRSKNPWSWCIIVAASLTSAAAESTDGACSAQPWNVTKCCMGAEMGAVTTGNLAVTECDSVSGINHVGLQWDHSTLQEEDRTLSRIFLFSHCINPTNTSLAGQLGTLLYSSDRSHLTSSTTTSYPVTSACSYFGCYEGCFGLCRYTFSEVSCTTPNADSMTSSTMLMTSLEIYPSLQTSNPGITVPSTAVVTPSLSTLPNVASGILATLQPTSVFTADYSIVVSTTLAYDAPTSRGNGIHNKPETTPTSVQLWIIPLLLIGTLLTVTCFGLAVARSITRPRNLVTTMKGVSLYSDPSSSSGAGKYSQTIDMRGLDTLSLRTLYEDVNIEHTQKVLVVSTGHMQEHSTDENVSTPDTGPCDTSSGLSIEGRTGTYNNSCSACTTDDSGNASYVTYGSLNTLFPELTKVQTESSCSS